MRSVAVLGSVMMLGALIGCDAFVGGGPTASSGDDVLPHCALPESRALSASDSQTSLDCGVAGSGRVVNRIGNPYKLTLGCHPPLMRCWICPILRAHPVDFEFCGEVQRATGDICCQEDAVVAACFQNALATCTPAMQSIERSNPDGSFTLELDFVTPDGDGGCTLERVTDGVRETCATLDETDTCHPRVADCAAPEALGCGPC